MRDPQNTTLAAANAHSSAVIRRPVHLLCISGFTIENLQFQVSPGLFGLIAFPAKRDP